MAKTWNEITIKQLEHVAEALKNTTSNIAQIMSQMLQHEMKTVFAPWTDAHVRHLGAITKFATDTLGEMGDQIAAKKFGTKSRVQSEKEKAAKTTANRKKSAAKRKPK